MAHFGRFSYKHRTFYNPKHIWLTELTKYWCYWIFSIIWLLKTLYSGFNGSHMWVISPEIIRNLVFSNILPFETLKPFETHVGDNAIHMTVTALGIIFGGAKPDRSKAKVRPSEARESQAKRDVDRAKRGSKQLGFVGRCKPPNGVQGQRPGKFWDFSPSRCPEIAIPACFQWITEQTQADWWEEVEFIWGAFVGKIYWKIYWKWHTT